MSARFRESEEFRHGRIAEHIVDRVLKKRGCYIIPSYDYSGQGGNKAPRLQGLMEGHPIPDLDVCRNAIRFWVEVKSKGYSPRWNLAPGGPQHTHGIERRLWEHYLTVEVISGCPVYLFIFERDTRWLLSERLDALGKPVSHGNDGRGKPIVFWFRKQLRPVEQIAEDLIAEITRLVDSQDAENAA